MIIPIRCFTCGKPLAHLWEKYQEKLQEEVKKNNLQNVNNYPVHIDKIHDKSFEGKLLDELGIKRYCCRRMMMGNVDLTEKI